MQNFIFPETLILALENIRIFAHIQTASLVTWTHGFSKWIFPLKLENAKILHLQYILIA